MRAYISDEWHVTEVTFGQFDGIIGVLRLYDNPEQTAVPNVWPKQSLDFWVPLFVYRVGNEDFRMERGCVWSKSD